VIRCAIDDKCYINNCLSLKREFHALRVKHTTSHLHDSPRLLLSRTIMLRSIGNNLLPRNAPRAEKLLKIIINVLASPISPKILDLLFALSFGKRLEFLEFGKHLIHGFNGVDLEEPRIVIIKGEGVLGSLKRSGGHGVINVIVN